MPASAQAYKSCSARQQGDAIQDGGNEHLGVRLSSEVPNHKPLYPTTSIHSGKCTTALSIASTRIINYRGGWFFGNHRQVSVYGGGRSVS